jgi:hypothetical protein
VTIELKPEQERIIQQQLASRHFKSVDEVLDGALASLPHDRRFDPENRREAVRRIIEFGERRKLSLGGKQITWLTTSPDV